MSNLGQAALTIVGTAIGYYVGYPQLGLVLGSLAGQALFPTQLPGITGPKISDLNTTTAELGGPVPWVFGTIGVPGTVIYLGQLVTITTTTHQGKGGPEQSATSFSYTQSLAVGLCRGIVGLRRVWENGELVFDARPQLPDESDDAFDKRVKAAGQYAETFVFYPGDEEQLPDPTIELEKGVGNTPAFRGLAYIVYPDRVLREDQALRHPSFRFEVFTSGTGGCVEDDELIPAVLHPWTAATSGNPANPGNTHEYRIVQKPDDASIGSAGPFDTAEAALEEIEEALAVSFPDVSYGGPYLLGNSPGTALDQIVWANMGGPTALDVGWRDAESVVLHYTPNNPNPVLSPISFFGNPGGICDGAFTSQSGFSHDGIVSWWYSYFPDVPTEGFWETRQGCGLVGGGIAHTINWVIRVTRVPGPPSNPCEGQLERPPGYYTAPDGTVIACQEYEEVDNPHNSYLILADWYTTEIQLGPDFLGTTVVFDMTRPAQGPIILETSPDNTPLFWQTAYEKAVLASTLPAGWTWNNQYPVTMSSRLFKRAGQRCSIAVDKVSLADVIEQICQATGITALADVDTQDLRDVRIDGYALASIMTARDALTPLRSVGFWDCVESGRTLKFVSRGKDSVATISQSDLGAADAEGGESAAPAVKTDRMQEVDLPRRIRVHYIAPSRDYGDGQQQSPARTTKAVNDTDVQLAVALGDDQAAQIAEVLWADAWAGRQSYTINLDRSYLPLEGADCIHLPTDGSVVRARILSISDASALLRKLSLIQDDNQAYVSQAVAQAPQIPISTIKLASSTNLLLLDLPALSDSDDDAGIYGVADEAVDGTAWAGAIIYRSIDGSTGWTQLGVATVQAPRGTVISPAPAGPSDMWDRGSSLTVELDYGPDLENRTEADLLNGANAAAVGSNGRWEIIQFATATRGDGNQYVLTNLLRGRRGTESQIGTGEAGDYFVVISTGALNRYPIDISNLGTSYVYRAVTIGKTFAEGIDQTFAGHGRALVPFSPVEPSLDRADSGELTLSWIRRGRLGQELRDGTDIPLSEASEAYDVEILSSGGSPEQILRTYRSTMQSAVYSTADQVIDHGFILLIGQHLIAKVYQVSETVGRGPPLEVDLRIGGILPAPPTVTHAAVFVFGGTFNADDNVIVSLIFIPSDGSATTHATMTLTGSTKAALSDYASDLAGQVAGAFDARVTTNQSGATLTIGSTFGSFIASYITNSPISRVAKIQDAGPVNAGNRSIWFVDLFTGLDFLAPDSAAAYSQAGQGLLTITVHSYDADEENRLSRLQLPPIPAGLEEGEFYSHGVSSTVVYAVDSGASSRLSTLSHLPNAIQNDPIIGAYVLGATLGQITGTPDGTMTRAAVSFSMKPGYYVALNEGQPQPSGFLAKIRLLQNGAAAYTSPGRKQIATVQFADAFDYQTGIYYSQIEVGQVYKVTINGVTYSHTADSTDLTDPNVNPAAGFYHDFIYNDLTSQIEGAGYTVVQDKLYRMHGSTDTFVVQLAIYGAGNATYTVSADVPFDTIVTLTVT